MNKPAGGPVCDRALGICTEEVRDAQATRGDRPGCSPLVGLDGGRRVALAASAAAAARRWDERGGREEGGS